MDPVLEQAKDRLENAFDAFRRDIAGIRVGRANPSFIEDIQVEAYGSRMKLVEVGNISAPQPSLLTVQVWDAAILQNVIKAIQEAKLGLNSSNEGTLIRLPIPALTQERREEFIKLLHQKMEEGRIQIRQIRQDLRNEWKQQLDNGDFGEDELDRREKLLQEVIEKRMHDIDNLGKQKEKELLGI